MRKIHTLNPIKYMRLDKVFVIVAQAVKCSIFTMKTIIKSSIQWKRRKYYIQSCYCLIKMPFKYRTFLMQKKETEQNTRLCKLRLQKDVEFPLFWIIIYFIVWFSRIVLFLLVVFTNLVCLPEKKNSHIHPDRQKRKKERN